MEPDAQRLRQILRDARATARLSQLALALRLNVSQRHLSFVESGRALPSRGLLLAWLEELHVPLVARNEALQSAGYAPSFASRALGDADLAQATDAVRRLLATHDPMPAWVVDADWNVLNANRGAQWLVGLLLPPSLPSSPPSHAPLNMLDLMTAPEGITARIVNLHEVAHPMLAQLRAEAAVHPALTPKVEALRALLRQRLGADLPLRDEVRRAAPVLIQVKNRQAHGF